MADINITTGIIPGTQIPLDSKRYVKTLNELYDLGTDNYKAFLYYDGMIVFCLENKKKYIWTEQQSVVISPSNPFSFTYPSNSVVNGIDYSGKTFYFEEYYNFSENDFSDKIISGDILWVQGLTFKSTPFLYRINGNNLSAIETTFNLSPSDPSLDRIDVFVCNLNGTITVIEGTPSNNPKEPVVNFANQLRITSVYIKAGDSTPTGIGRNIIFDENLQEPNEWNYNITNILDTSTTISTSTIIFNSQNDPKNGAISIETTLFNKNLLLNFLKTNQIFDVADISSLAFDIKHKVSKEYRIKIKLLYGEIEKANIVIINGQYGLNTLNTNSYQSIVIPITAFVFNTRQMVFNKIVFSFDDTSISASQIAGVSFFMDNIRLIYSNERRISQNTFFSINDVLDSSYYKKAGYTPVVNESETGILLKKLPEFTDIYSGNAIINGGIRHISGLTYNVWATSYIINNKVYFDNPISKDLTIQNGGPTNPRIDVFAIFNDGNGSYGAKIIQGTEDPNPQKPSINLTIEAEIGFKLINPNQNTDNEINENLVFDENVGAPLEFNNNLIPAGAVIDNVIFNSGTKSFKITPIGGVLGFTTNPSINFTEDSVLFFALMIQNNFEDTESIVISLLNNGNSYSNSNLIIDRRNSEKFNLQLNNKNSLNKWQIASIPFSYFKNFGENFYNEIQFNFSLKNNIWIDTIKIQKGLSQPKPIECCDDKKLKSIEDLKNIINKSINDFIETVGYYSGSNKGGAIYQKVDPTGLTPNDMDIIQANDGSYWQIKVDTLTPFMFGVRESTAADTSKLQAFFNYIRDNNVVGDFRGTWIVDTMITIDGLGKTFQCGNIYAVNSGLDVTVKITTGYSLFYGEFQVMGNEGSNVTTYTSRTSNIGVLMENVNGRNYYERFNIRSYKSWGIKAYGAGGATSLILNWIGNAKIWNCGSGNSATRELKFNIVAYTNNGSSGSSSQTATITAENSLEDVFYMGYIEINGRLHKILSSDIPNKQLTIYPWVDTSIPDPTVTPFEVTSYHGGAILIEGGNSASFRIDQIDSIGAGTCVADYGLYGADIGVIQGQFCKISYAYGDGSSLGGKVSVYSEAAQYSIVQRKGTSDNYASNRVIHLKVASGNRDGLASIGNTISPYSSWNTRSWYSTLQSSVWYQNAWNEPVISQAENNLPNTPIMGNSPINGANNLMAIDDNLTVELKWDEAANQVFGYDKAEAVVFGTGSNNNPTGTITFNLDSADQTAGITVMGDTTYTLSGLSNPANIKIVFDYANQNWLIKNYGESQSVFTSLEVKSPTGGTQRITRDDIIIGNGDSLGKLEFAGNDAGVDPNDTVGAEIEAVTENIWGSGSQAKAAIIFKTRENELQIPVERFRVKSSGVLNASNVPTYADDTAAGAGGLVTGDVYKTATGLLMIKL